jgi:hypothetical protein
MKHTHNAKCMLVRLGSCKLQRLHLLFLRTNAELMCLNYTELDEVRAPSGRLDLY